MYVGYMIVHTDSIYSFTFFSHKYVYTYYGILW